jgi:hypothetical protein
VNWQVWSGPLVGVLGLLFAVYAYNMNRKPKRLTYEVVTNQPIITASRYTRWAELSLRFGERELENPRLVVVRVTNTGKVEARSDDIDEPITVAAKGASEIVTARITQRRSGDEEVREVEPSSVTPSTVVAPKVLLNEGEWLEFQLIVDGGRDPIAVGGRVAGFSLRPYVPKRIPRFTFTHSLVGLLAATAAVLVTLWAYSILFPKVVVPDLTGEPQSTAETMITLNRLELGNVESVPDEAPYGWVIEQFPEAGQEVDEGTTVQLVVSSGIPGT